MADDPLGADSRLETARRHLRKLSPEDRNAASVLVTLIEQLREVCGAGEDTFAVLSEFSALDPPLQRVVLEAFERSIRSEVPGRCAPRGQSTRPARAIAQRRRRTRDEE